MITTCHLLPTQTEVVVRMPSTPSFLAATVRGQELRKHELSSVLVCLLSLQLTSQDKTPAVIQRAMSKHNLESDPAEEYELVQVISEDKGIGILSPMAGASCMHTLLSC